MPCCPTFSPPLPSTTCIERTRISFTLRSSIHLDHHRSPVISHPVSRRIDQFELTSARSALEFDEPSDSTPRFSSSTDSRTDPNTAHLFLFSPPFHGSVGRAATPSRTPMRTAASTTLVARFNGITEREKFATGPPGANSTQRRSFRNERRPVVVAARRGERTTLRMTIRALHHLETTFRRYRHHRRRRHLHHHSSLAHLHSLLATSTSTSFTNTTP